MAFDPITYTAVVNAKSPIGSLERVVSSFSDSKFLSSNQVFNADEFPALADKVDSGFKADFWKKSTIPAILSDFSTNYRLIGNVHLGWESATDYYLMTFLTSGVTAGNYLYKIDKSMTGPITLVRYMPFPVGGGTSPRYSIVGTLLFQSYANKAYNVYNLATDPGLSTPEARTLPATAQGWPYAFATGNGITMAVTTGALLGTAGASFKSTDGGLTWAAPTTVAGIHPTSTINNLVFGNGTFVVTSSASATGNYAYTTTGTSWAGGLTSPATGRGATLFDPTRNVFMAFPTAAAGVILESANGSTWTSGATCPVACPYPFSAMLATDNSIVVGMPNFAGSTVPVIATTTNRTSFTQYDSSVDPATNSWSSMTVVGTKVLKVSANATPGAFTGAQRLNFGEASTLASWTTPLDLPKSKLTTYTPLINGTNLVMLDNNPLLSGQFTSVWNGVASNDNGETWTPFSINTGADQIAWGGVTSTPTGFFAAGKVGQTGSSGNFVYATSTDGLNWNYVNTNGTPAALTVVNSVVCNQSGVIMVSTNSGSGNTLRSTNNGATWTSINVASGIAANGIMLAVGNNFMFGSYTNSAITGSYLKYSADGGLTFNNALTVPTTTASYFVASASGVHGINTIGVYLVTRSTGTLKDVIYTLNGGTTWALATLPTSVASATAIGVAVVNGVVVITLNNGYIVRTTDITTNSLWEVSSVYTTTGDLTTYNFGAIANSFDRTNAIMLAPNSLDENFVVRGLNEPSTYRRVPYMPSDVPNTKWVIRAK
jgi:hypothetical protein